MREMRTQDSVKNYMSDRIGGRRWRFKGVPLRNIGSELTIDTAQGIGDITGTIHFEPIRYPLSIHWRLHPRLASYSDFHRIACG